MTRFLDGPAQGETLMLRRAPILLRVTRDPMGNFDGLDQLDDRPDKVNPAGVLKWKPSPEKQQPATRETKPPVRETKRPKNDKQPEKISVDLDETLKPCSVALLNVIAQYPEGCTLDKACIVAGYKPGSGGVGQAVAQLKRLGLIDKSGQSHFRATVEGCATANPIDLPSGSNLLEYWRGKLSPCARELLTVYFDAYPKEMHINDACASCPNPYKPGSGGVGQAVAELKKAEVITGARGVFRASAVFFED